MVHLTITIIGSVVKLIESYITSLITITNKKEVILLSKGIGITGNLFFLKTSNFYFYEYYKYTLLKILKK